MAEQQTGSEKVANNVVLLLVSRIAMVVASGALPIAGWVLERAVVAVDNLGVKVDGLRDDLKDTSANVRLVQQTQVIHQQVLADHEARIRILEGHAKP